MTIYQRQNSNMEPNEIMHARFDAGLVLAGYNEDGEPEWIGTQEQWERAEELENQLI